MNQQRKTAEPPTILVVEDYYVKWDIEFALPNVDRWSFNADHFNQTRTGWPNENHVCS